jgi:hypothetical protein
MTARIECAIILAANSQLKNIQEYAMATEAITIKVDSEAARVFNTAPAEEQRKMEALLSLWLKEIAAADARPLKEVMDEIGREAQRRGMTPEVLESILNDE